MAGKPPRASSSLLTEGTQAPQTVQEMTTMTFLEHPLWVPADLILHRISVLSVGGESSVSSHQPLALNPFGHYFIPSLCDHCLTYHQKNGNCLHCINFGF